MVCLSHCECSLKIYPSVLVDPEVKKLSFFLLNVWIYFIAGWLWYERDLCNSYIWICWPLPGISYTWMLNFTSFLLCFAYVFLVCSRYMLVFEVWLQKGSVFIKSNSKVLSFSYCFEWILSQCMLETQIWGFQIASAKTLKLRQIKIF